MGMKPFPSVPRVVRPPRRRAASRLVPVGIAVVIGAALLWLVAPTLGGYVGGQAFTESLRALALAAIPAILVVQYDHYRTIREVGEDIEDTLDVLIAGRLRYGLARIHHRLDYSALFAELLPTDELLWLDTYCPLDEGYYNSMKAALRRGAHVKILTIAPHCDNARNRAMEITAGFLPEGDDELEQDDNVFHERFEEEVERFVAHLLDVLEDLEKKPAAKVRERAEVRMYDDLPCVPMYIIRARGQDSATANVSPGRPRRGFSSMFLAHPTANFPHFEWNPTDIQGGFALEALARYFDEKWERHKGDGCYPTPSGLGLQQGSVLRGAHDQRGAFGREEVAAILDELRRLSSDAKVSATLQRMGRHEAQANIQVAELGPAGSLVSYVASLRAGESVNPHVHADGDEIYLIVRGSGQMHMGPATMDTRPPKVDWREPIAMTDSTHVVIPGGWAHRLENTDDRELTFLFACPRDHMLASDEGGDRIMIEFPAGKQGGL